MLHDGKDVEVRHTISDEVEILCSLKLFFYPFDSPVMKSVKERMQWLTSIVLDSVQSCNFTLELMSNVIPDVEWKRDTSFAKLRSDFSLMLYDDLKFKLHLDETQTKVNPREEHLFSA